MDVNVDIQQNELAAPSTENVSSNESNGKPQVAPTTSNMDNAEGCSTYLQKLPPSVYESPYLSETTRATTDFMAPPVFSKETSEVIASIKAKGVSNLTHGSSEWETAKQAVRAEMDMKDTNGVPTAGNPTAARTGGRRGRGPRRRGSPTLHDAIMLSPAESHGQGVLQNPSTPLVSRGKGRGGKPRGSRARGGMLRGGTKRKRTRGEDEDGNMSTSSEEITNMPTQSRSGRKIIQATQPMPVIKIDYDDAEPSPARSLPSVSLTKATTAKKIVKKRTPGASAVCKNCTRGHSPASNAIVFCDGCNTPWHQYCHDPPIKKDYLVYVDKDWFCADCVILREEKGKLQGKASGEWMSLADKRKYLQTLSHNTLVSLLLHATSVHPSLPFYPPKPVYVIPPSPSVLANSAATATIGAILEEDEYYSEDELPYPKAGNGLQLPPESEDLSILIDDDSEAYSHRWTGITDMLAEVARLGVSSPNRSGLGVRTGNGGYGVRIGA